MSAALGALDWLVLVAYLAGVILMSFAFARRQTSGEDYFLAGRSMKATPLALSVMANQASAVSLIGAPAFVALREGGGLVWLQYELALPLAMLALVALLLPLLRASAGSSIYAWAERRFGRSTRTALALAFLLARGLSLGVVLLASALVVAEALGTEVRTALLVVGLFAVGYTTLGGIVADIWSDVIQLVLLWGGTLVSGAYLVEHAGLEVLRQIPAERTTALALRATGLGDGATFALWPMLFGGFFLYLSYYGCDQSQAQRLLTAKDDAAARRALVLNGLLRFPLVLSYCGFGLLLAGLLRSDPAFAATLLGRPPDSLVPAFMMSYLPSGLRGLLLAAILAAAMSSIDSALNSLAAVTLEDVLGIEPRRQSVWLGRATSLAWGLLAIGAGIGFAHSGKGVLELVNQVGSAFYGPVLAVFLLGACAPRCTGRGAIAGLVSGLLLNLALARFAPGVSWLWWNVFSTLLAFGVAVVVDRAPPRLPPLSLARRDAWLLGGAFVLMLLLLAALGWS